MRQFAAVVYLTGALSLLAPAQSSLGLIQPDAGLVFGIEWRKVVDSPVGAMLAEQLKKSDLPKFPGAEALEQILLHDLDSVLIASPASGMSKNASQPPALIIVKGRFNVDQLRSMVMGMGKSRKVEIYRGVELLGAPAGASKAGPNKAAPDNTVVAFLDGKTILAGDRTELRAAIDRMKTGRLTDANRGILAGVAELAARNHLWMILEMPPNALKDAPPMAAQMFSGVKSTELGMSFEEGFGLQVNVRTKDDASAQTIAQGLQGLLAMAAMSQTDKPQSAELIKKIRIAPEGSKVKLALALDRSELEKIIKEAQASRTATLTSAPKSPARALEPAGPRTVRITGLDSGPVEVPFSESKK